MKFEDYSSKSFLENQNPIRENTNERAIDRRTFFKMAGFGLLSGVTLVEAQKMKLFEKAASLLETQEEVETKREELLEEEPLTPQEEKMIGETFDYDSAKIEFSLEKQDLLRRKWKQRYQEDILYKNELEKTLAKMEPWKEQLSQIFSSHDVPEEFQFLAVVESYFRSRARSEAGAVGPYQLMKQTAHDYGLKVGKGVDERQDILKSATACAKLLSDLFSSNKDWDLALSAYNGGFVWEYRKEAKNKGEEISADGFYRHLGELAENLQHEIKTSSHLPYTIKQGDSISRIAKRHGLKPKDLATHNKIGIHAKIKAGTEINIPLSQSNKKDIFNRKVAGIVQNANYCAKCKAVFELVKEKYS